MKEQTAQEIIQGELLNYKFKSKEGTDSYRHAKGRDVYIVDFRREFNNGIETIIVSICFDTPNQAASLGWFKGSDFILIGKNHAR